LHTLVYYFSLRVRNELSFPFIMQKIAACGVYPFESLRAGSERSRTGSAGLLENENP
jgi:hypothetical protein